MAEQTCIQNCPVRHHQCDAAGNLKAAALGDAMQDAAAAHADRLGFGMTAMRDAGLIWVLSRLNYRLRRPVRLGEILTVETYPRGLDRIFARRCFQLRCGSEIVGEAGSLWLIVNQNGRPCNPKKVLPREMPENNELPLFFPETVKTEPPAGTNCGTYRTGAGDIDLNRHLNNAVYARLTADAVGFLSGSVAPFFRELQLDFLRANELGEELTLTGTVTDERFTVAGTRADSVTSFAAAGIWEAGLSSPLC